MLEELNEEISDDIIDHEKLEDYPGNIISSHSKNLLNGNITEDQLNSLKESIHQTDNLLSEKIDIIEKLETELKLSNNILIELTKKNNELKEELNSKKIKIEKLSNSNINSEHKPNHKYNTLKDKINLLSRIKTETETQSKENINLINNNCRKLTEISLKIEEILAETNSLNEINNNLKEKIAQNNNYINNLKSKLNQFSNIKEVNESYLSYMNKANSIQNQGLEIGIDNRNNILDEDILNSEIIKLKMKVEDLAKFRKSYDTQKMNYIVKNNILNDLNLKNNINKNIANDKQNKLINLCDIINKNFDILNEWINKHFGEVGDNNNDVIQKTTKIDDIKFPLLCETLIKKNKKLNEDYNILVKRNNSYINDNQKLLDKIKIQENENNQISQNIQILLLEKNNLINELETLKKFLDKINDNVLENQKENDSLKFQIKNITEEKNDNYYSIHFKKLNDALNILKIKNDELLKEKNSLETQIEDLQKNNLELEEKYNKNYNNTFRKMNDKINKGHQKNLQKLENYNEKLENLENENNMLKYNNEILKKEYNNIMCQLNKVNGGEINGNEQFKNKKLILKLENDRSDLLRDKEILINENNLLKSQINELKKNMENSNE